MIRVKEWQFVSRQCIISNDVEFAREVFAHKDQVKTAFHQA